MATYDIPTAVHRAVLAGTDRIPTPRAQEGEVTCRCCGAPDPLCAPESRTTAADHLSTRATDTRGVTGRSRQGIGNDDGGAR